MKLPIIILSVAAMSAQRTDTTIAPLSLNADGQLAMHEWRSGIADPAFTGILITTAIDAASRTIVINDATLPSTPFQLVMRNGGTEIVRVTAVMRTVEPPAPNPPQPPNYITLTVARGMAGTAAKAWPAGTTASVPRYQNIEAALLGEVLKPFVKSKVGESVSRLQKADKAKLDAAVEVAKEEAVR